MKLPILAHLLLLISLASNARAQTTFTKITTGPVVTDEADGQGCAWVDIDNDGLLDLFVSCNRTGTNLLYRNEGKGVFTKITTGALPNAGGGSYSASWADIDNDGRIDLFISKQDGSPGLLFHQEANGSFTQSSLPSGGLARGSAWGDYDRDGFVDLRTGDTTQDILWHNDGGGNLVPVTGGPAVAPNAGQLTWVDFDNDGDSDLVITSGASAAPCRLFRNDGRGVFTEVTRSGLEAATFCTALAWGDYDNDGFPDLFVTRLDGSFQQPLPSFLFHNNGDGTFTQVQQGPFTTDTGFAASCSWGDYDNDGWLDLIVSNVRGARNRLYHNNGDGTFTRVESGSVANDLNCSIGCVWGDYDRDGFLDLFIANGTVCDGDANDFLYHNDGNTNAWLTVKCVGTRSNRSAIGAKVWVKAAINSQTFWQLREINTGSGLSQNAMEAHFGLGNATNVDTLRIEWPSGTAQELRNVGPKRFLTVTEPSRLLVSATKEFPQVTLQGGRNVEYDIQTSTNLLTWSLLDTLTVTNLNGRALLPNTNAPSSGGRFYRAVLHSSAP
jgi:hypothetical protein